MKTTTLPEILDSLDAQYERMTRKVRAGERLETVDLPHFSIEDVKHFPDYVKDKIYLRQCGFEFHGMRSERRATIIHAFDGTSVWIPEECSRFMSRKGFEEKLELSYSLSSKVHDLLILKRKDKCQEYPFLTSKSEGALKESFSAGNVFYWDLLMIHCYEGVPSINAPFLHERIVLLEAPRLQKDRVSEIERRNRVMTAFWTYLLWNIPKEERCLYQIA